MSTALASRPAPAVNSSDVFLGLALRFLRHGAGVLTSVIFLLCGLPAMMYGFVWIVAPLTARYMGGDPGILQTIFRIGEWFVVPALLLPEVTHVRPLYVLPLTNRQILRTQLALGIMAIAALHLFSVVFYRVLFGATLPLWGPLMFLIPTVVAAAGLAAWLADFRWWRPFVAAAAVIGGSSVVGQRLIKWGSGAAVQDSAAWLTPTPVEFVGILLLGAVGYFTAQRGIERDRCRELRAWPDLDTLLQSFSARLSRLWRSPVVIAPYRSGVSAQFWFEFWQKGLIVPVIATGIGGLTLFAAVFQPHVWLQGFAEAFPGLLGLCLFAAGLIVGLINLGRQGKTKGTVIGDYRATRPLTDAQFSYAVLKAALASVFATAMVGVAFALLVAGWAMIGPFSGPWPSQAVVESLRMLPVFAVVGWCLLGFAASIAMTGRAWVMILPFAMGIGTFLVQPLLREPPLSTYGVERLIGGAVVLSIVAGTLAAYVVAVRRDVISWRTVSFGCMLCMGVLSQTDPVFGEPGTRMTAIDVVLTALIAVPLATAPLALSWNRHR